MSRIYIDWFRTDIKVKSNVEAQKNSLYWILTSHFLLRATGYVQHRALLQMVNQVIINPQRSPKETSYSCHTNCYQKNPCNGKLILIRILMLHGKLILRKRIWVSYFHSYSTGSLSWRCSFRCKEMVWIMRSFGLCVRRSIGNQLHCEEGSGSGSRSTPMVRII